MRLTKKNIFFIWQVQVNVDFEVERIVSLSTHTSGRCWLASVVVVFLEIKKKNIEKICKKICFATHFSAHSPLLVRLALFCNFIKFWKYFCRFLSCSTSAGWAFTLANPSLVKHSAKSRTGWYGRKQFSFNTTAFGGRALFGECR